MSSLSFSSFLIITCAVFFEGLASNEVPFTPVSNYIQRRAVCMDGSPAGYYHAAGSGDGVKNWLVSLMGGGWCGSEDFCENQTINSHGSTIHTPAFNLTGILSKQRDINPDFYNWNRIYVHYCDQSSFLGDSEFNGSKRNYQFRGSRIYDTVIEDLLEKGMKNAENAMLGGQSAGALAAIIHCDGFRASLPDAARVKCFSDSGFFIRAKDLPASGAKQRDQYFGSTIALHNISSLLPTSCTKRLDPSLCLFPENLVGDVQTPLFLLNSAFDSYLIQYSLVPEAESQEIWDICRYLKKENFTNSCTPTQKQLIRDYGKTLLKTITDLPDNPSRGIFINTCFTHVFSMSLYFDELWTPHSTLRLGKNMENMLEAVGNWYFDRNSVYLIDNRTQFPQNCKVYI